MKAFLILVLLYVGAFLIATQGASQSPVEAAPQEQSHAAAVSPSGTTLDSSKEAEIRSLMELVGVRDLMQDASTKAVEQFRQNLMASVPERDRGEKFVNAFFAEYKEKFNPDDVTSQMVAIYDEHFTDDEIKGLLQFYGSPLGQKFAAEMPKVAAEAQAANRALSARVAKEVLQDLRSQYPAITARARLRKPRSGQTEQAKQQTDTQPETQASASQP
jgi:hypothetical protein